MEAVNKDNIQRFYNGDKICHINPWNGKEEIIKFICEDCDEIIVRIYDILDFYTERLGSATSLAEFEIVNGYYYFYTNENDLYEKQIEWHNKQIKHIEEKIKK